MPVKKKMPIKILIVDDQRLFRRGLKVLLEREKDITVVGEASDGQEAFTLATEKNPDIILMDTDMPKLDGINATKLILERCPKIKILMLSIHDEDEWIIGGIKAGALGYILKDADDNEFIKIIKSTHKGEKISSPFLANLEAKIILKVQDISSMNDEQKDGLRNKFSITAREIEILDLLLKGKVNKEIADEIHVSIETVKKHLQNLYKKLDVNNKVDLILRFLKR